MSNTITKSLKDLRIAEQDIRDYLDKYVHEVETVNDVPFGVLVSQLTAHIWVGTDQHLYVVKGGN